MVAPFTCPGPLMSSWSIHSEQSQIILKYILLSWAKKLKKRVQFIEDPLLHNAHALFASKFEINVFLNVSKCAAPKVSLELSLL